MTDLVERLRGYKSELQAGSSLHDTGECREVMSDAANEIAQLRIERDDARREVERLRKDVQNLNRDCMMLAGNSHGTVQPQ